MEAGPEPMMATFLPCFGFYLGDGLFTIGVRPVGYKAFDPSDGNGQVNVFQGLAHGTGQLTLDLLGADPAADGGKKTCALDYGEGLFVVTFGGGLDEAGDVDLHRASGYAGSGLALQAAFSLDFDLFLEVAQGHLVHVLFPDFRVLGGHLLPWQGEPVFWL